MSKKNIFQKVFNDFFERPLDHVITRNQELPLNVPKIVSLLGPRRSGKTYMLYDVIKKLSVDLPRERLVYINFEDDRLFPLQLSDMEDLMDGYYEQFPSHKEKVVYFFFDEIQEVEHWEKFVRRIHDQENCRIYLTGSSSRMLSKELSTTLRGRSLPYEVFPLSFSEFLRFNNISSKSKTSKEQAQIKNALQRYHQQGGYPELVFLPPELHNRTINEYIDLTLYRDLIERFDIKQPHLMKYLLKHIIINMSKPLSINKLYNDVKSQGYKIAKDTIYDYISYLEDAFIIFPIKIRSQSIRKQAVNPTKMYIIDPAFKYAMSMAEDHGRLLENQVFLHLRRQGFELNYVQGKQEVDFYWDGGVLTNVCYDYSDESTRLREVNGLREAMRDLGHHTAQIVTIDTEEVIEVAEGKIEVQPVWKMYLKG